MTRKPDEIIPAGRLSPETSIRDALETLGRDKRKRTGRFVLAALSSIPWVGGFLSASASLDAEVEQGRVNELQREWLEEHRRKLIELAKALSEIADRVEGLGLDAEVRADTPQYLALVRKGFSVWDRSDTPDKRELIQRLLANAAGTSLSADDLVRLFIEWIDRYHEAHFAVIRTIYHAPRSTRSDIWDEVHGRDVAENSAEADLFRLLIRDLSTGSVIRQHRETTTDGQFRKKARSVGARPTRVMKSAFDDKEEYELTELGKQFVHYVLSDIVPRMADPSESR